MRRAAQALLTPTTGGRASLVWLAPAGLVAAGALTGAAVPVLAGMGLAAGLSLSGSI